MAICTQHIHFSCRSSVKDARQSFEREVEQCREFQDTESRAIAMTERKCKEKRFIPHWENTLIRTQCFWWLQGQTSSFILGLSLRQFKANIIILNLSKFSAVSEIKDRISRLWWRYHRRFRSWWLTWNSNFFDCHSLYTTPLATWDQFIPASNDYMMGKFYEKVDIWCSCGGARRWQGERP